MPTLIGIYGRARSGKDTAADYLAKRHGLLKYAFAEPIKQMLKAVFGDHFHEGDRSGICPETGKSYREMMQTIGTEWGRDMMHPELWVRMAAKKWQWVQDGCPFETPIGTASHVCLGDKPVNNGMIISDVRFRSEAEWIRRAGGVVIQLYGRGSDVPVGIPGHISESGLRLNEVDMGLNNNGDLEHLKYLLDGVGIFLNLEPVN